MHANLPEIAKRWERDYANGGIARVGLANGSIGNKTHAETFLDLYQNSPTTKDYNINVNADLANRISKGLRNVPYIGSALSTAADVAMPAAAFIGSPFYDALQGTYRGIKDPNKSVWEAVKDENIGSTMWERMVGASAPLAERLSNLNFGSSAQAATPDDITRAMQTDHMRRRTNFPTTVPAHMRRQTFDNVNFNEWMRNDINLAKRKSTAQKFANLDNFTRSPHTGFKKSGADLDKWGNRRMALENPAKDPYNTTSWYNQPTLERMWNDPRRPDDFGLGSLKDWATDKIGTGINWGKAALSGIGNAIMPGLGFVLSALNPGKLRGYNYNQGRYNTQAEYEANRAARRHKARIDYMMDRRAAGKGFSQANLNEATMGSKPGYYGNVWGGEGTGMTGGQSIPGAPTNLGQSVHGEGPIGGKDNQSGGGNWGNAPGTPGGWGPGKNRKDGGRIGYQGGGLASLWPR